MRAIVCTAYGDPDVLRLEEVETPRPKAGEVLVRVHATTASRADCEIRKFEFPVWVWLPIRLSFGVFKPRKRILGQEFAGQVEAVGAGASSFAQGDRVYGTTGMALGAYAQFVCAGGRRVGSVLAPLPAALSYDEAAAVPYGAMEALRFLRKAGIAAGQRVLIVGAGGSFGTFAVQLARHAGAEVVAVDSGGKLEMLRELGAGEVIDYTAGDFWDDAGDFDIIFDVVGRAPFGRVARLLRPGGRYVVANPHTAQLVRGLWASMAGDKKLIFSSGAVSDEHLRAVTELVESGALRPVVDRRYPLEQAAEAHRYADSEQKLGNIVLVVDDAQGSQPSARPR
jgi:NADPH:quinone reductase-like Zn-dependent oxidoreductase